MQLMGYSAAILGASGYAGGELIRILDDHPFFEVAYLGAHTRADSRLGEVHSHLGQPDRMLGPVDPELLSDCEVAFLALPHGASWETAHLLAEQGVAVFDLGSDYRMDTPDRYRAAYGNDHPLPDHLESWIYGLPELFGDALSGARRVAVPGCYPTSALLGLAPLLAAGLVEGPIVVDSMSGVTGAGRGLKEDLLFGAIDESVRAYGIASHRHRPEIEMGLETASGRQQRVQFTPHLVPMQRGILSTCSATLTVEGETDRILRETFQETPFVDVIDLPPQTRWVVNSNRALIHAVEDHATGRVIVTVAIDNLGKGAAGQAVQCANLSLGLPETAGLATVGWLP
ncbi:MAG: N-acetyl-gamma-glutamyl-phosphate reductase [bacterium]|nr:N-acetyl-gamma-glutamyl-phosphate reductase [bacterium]